jgi:hypothetical protein
MTETELLYAITSGSRKRPGLCARLGIRWYHAYDSRRSIPGWPDLILIGNRIIFRELKSASGILRPEQRDWRDLLHAAGADWAIWRPADLESGRIEGELRALILADV